MSFELGLLMGLGRSALKERESRSQQQRLVQEETEKQNARSLATLQKFVETDDLLPDEARNIAAQHLFRLASDPKAKDTDYQKATQEVIAAANKPRALPPTPKDVATNAWNNVAGMDMSGGLLPGLGQIPRLPDPEQRMTSGILTHDERTARQEGDLRRQLQLRQEFEGPKYTPFSAGQGIMDNRGKVVREATPPVPKLPDAPNTPFQAAWLGAKTDEERAKIAADALKMQYTNQGDTPRPTRTGGGNSVGTAMMVDTPNGPALVFPRLMNPNAQGVVPLPAGTSKASTGAGADGGVSVADKRAFDMEQNLANQWTKESSSYKEMRRFNEGDKNGGSQGVLVTFQKILDPTSVVRESEYARSAQGISLLGRLDGYFERLAAGGAGVPADELSAMVTTAKQFLDGMKTYNDGVRARLDRAARTYNLAPGNVFDDITPPANTATGPRIGDRKKLKDGRTIVIKALSPDGRSVTDYDVVP